MVAATIRGSGITPAPLELPFITRQPGLDQVQKPTNFTNHIKTFVIMGPWFYRFRITRLSLE